MKNVELYVIIGIGVGIGVLAGVIALVSSPGKPSFPYAPRELLIPKAAFDRNSENATSHFIFISQCP